MKSNLFGLFYIFFTIGDVYSQSSVEIKVGDKINICCQLTFNENDALSIHGESIRLKMLRNGVMNDLDFSIFQEKYPEFNVEKVDSTLCLTKQTASLKDDNFTIVCKVIRNGMFETLATEKIIIRVFEELKFEIQPPEILNGSIGETKSVECRASGSPDLQVLWRSEKQGKIVSGNSNAILEIKDITLDMDKNKYTCEASISIPKNKPGSIISQTMTLNVYFLPEINIEMTIVHTELGDTENVTITVKGNPSPKLDCQLLDIKADRVVTISNPDPNMYVYSMEIFNVTQRHIGNYNCRAYNSQGSVVKDVLLSLKPANLQITSPNSTPYSNYYLLTWTINSKSLLTNTSILVEMDEAGNWSVAKHLNLIGDDLKSNQQTPGNQGNNWKKTFSYPLMNFTSDRQYRISLKACNKHDCIDSTSTAVVRTPKSDDKNKYDPNIAYVRDPNGPAGIANSLILSKLLLVVTQFTTLLFIPLLLQRIY